MSTVSVDASSARRAPASGRVQRKMGIAVTDIASAWATWVIVSAVAVSATTDASPTNSGYRRL